MQSPSTVACSVTIFGPSPARTLPASAGRDFLTLAANLCGAQMALLTLQVAGKPWPYVGMGLGRRQAQRLAEACTRRVADETDARLVDHADDVDFPTWFPEPSELVNRRHACAPVVARDGSLLGCLDLFGLKPTLSESALAHALTMLATSIADCIAPADVVDTATSGAPASTHQFAEAIASSQAAIIGIALDGTVTSWNQGAERLYGYRREEVLGTPVQRMLPKSRRLEEQRILAAIALGQPVAPYESQRLTRDRRTVHVVVSASPVRDVHGNVIGATKCIQDITPLICREREAKRQARLYATLSRVNRAIVECRTRAELLQETCRILVQEAEFTLAWIGWFDPDSGRLQPAAVSGTPGDYVQRIRVYGDDRDEGRGPTGLAFRSGKTQVSNDLLNDPATLPWRAQMKAAHLRASTAIPIVECGKIRGVLSVYARHPGYFQKTEVGLLEDVARSVALGFARIDRAEDARKAEEILENERNFSNVLIESTPGILCLWDRTLHGLRWSGNLPEVSGYSADELSRMRFLDFFPEAEHDALRAAIEGVFRTGHGAVEAHLLTKDGGTRPYLLTARRALFDGNECLVGVGVDISERIAAEQSRRLSEDRYRRLFESAPTGIAIVDPTGVYLETNPALARSLGYDENGLVGKRVIDVVAPEHRHRVDGVIADILAGKTDRDEWKLLHRDGSRVYFRSMSTRMSDGNMMVVLNDITARKVHERRIARLDRIRRMIGGIHSVMLRRSNRAGLLHDACRVAASQGDFALAAIVDIDAYTKRPRVLCLERAGADAEQPEDAARAAIAACDHLSLYAVRAGKPIFANELQPGGRPAAPQEPLPADAGTRSAAAFPLWISGRAQYALVLLAAEPDVFDSEEVELLEWMTGDLSFALDHLDTSQQLQHLTYYDPLTGLLNTRGIRERINRLVAAARERQQRLCICAIDLEHFARFNTRFGQEGGDRLLRGVSERLQKLAEREFIPARIGGDTFALVRLTSEDVGEDCFERHIPELFREPFDLDGVQVAIAFRAGIAVYPHGPEGYAQPLGLDHAVRALRKARNQGDTIAFYSAEDERLATRSLTLESQLQAALERDEFVLHYQPRLDIISGEIVGAEALVRWQHPEHGLLPPADFIEVAERSGMIRPLGTRVIQMVCRQQSAWRAAGIPIVPVAANVSGVQLNRDNLQQIVRQALADTALEPEWLELELTESAVMQDAIKSTRTLSALRDLGVKLSLDDFGTGYSSLSYLKRLPFHRVKIDRSFITDVTRSPEDAAIALAIIAIARSLKLTSVAEGVETGAQLSFLAKHHCDEMQGYFFSPPVDPDAFASFLREHRRLDLQPAGTFVGRSVLVVDDEPSICKALVRLLRRDGYQVLTADSGERALDLLALHHVQVVISDQRMPGMSGTELLDKVKSLYPDTIRVILSGYTDLNVITESVNRGAVFRFLTKPWNDDDLRAQIRNAFVHYDERKGGAEGAAGNTV